jgi:hypothetical protein
VWRVVCKLGAVWKTVCNNETTKGGAAMPVVAFNIKFSEAERALLAKRAKAEHMTEADYLRMCMIMDSVVSGDVDALKLIGTKLRDTVAEGVRKYTRRGVLAL